MVNGDLYFWCDLASHRPVGDEEAIVKHSSATRLPFVHDAIKVVDNQGARRTIKATVISARLVKTQSNGCRYIRIATGAKVVPSYDI